MEPIRHRPSLGDIFCPTTQLLNDENEYLCRVGLVILISGSPSPSLPGIIATSLATIYGGRQSDYMINQATIAPYLITCPNTRIRDAIVQRGIHSIPSIQTQFTVHEWRPRFGMGHDPPTHQVWVKITGLPLQAWTTPQITAVLQKFGHPIQILPYGQAAGHYRDVTALVATQNPNRIPMAYTYREGDYSTWIDVLILSWRLAEPGYFPPPNSPQARQNPHAYPHQNDDQAAPANHRHLSSSSSSSEVPNEPTIDLSAWSPRSYPISSFSVLKWVTKPAHHPQLSQPQYRLVSHNLPIALSDPPRKCYNLTADKRGQVTLFTQDLTRTAATADPTAQLDLIKTYPLRSVSVFTIPSPIDITPFFTHWIRCLNVRKEREPQDKPTLVRRSTPTALKCGENENITNITNSTTTGTFMVTPPTACPTGYPKTKKGPLQLQLQPITAQQDLPVLCAQAHSEITPQAQALQVRTTPPGSQSLPESPHLQACVSPSAGLHSLSPMHSQNTCDSSEMNSELSAEKETHSDPPVTNDPLTPDNTQISSSSMSLPTSTRYTATRAPRTTQQPTRRSRRLQEKSQPSGSAPNPPAKAKSRTVKIPFDLGSDLTLLDASKALQILQATGLEITEQIQQMMEGAIQQDQAHASNEASAPSTPLHDLIPPLEIPGESLLL